MALKTSGTVANNSLDALAFSKGLSAADVAEFQLKIKNDLNVAHPVYPGAFSLKGELYIPNRGILKVLDGDYVMVDEFGWPILVAAGSIASGTTDWAHS